MDDDARSRILWEIADIERKSIRAMREQCLEGMPGTQALYRLQDYDNQIAALRAQLTPEKTDGIDKDH